MGREFESVLVDLAEYASKVELRLTGLQDSEAHDEIEFSTELMKLVNFMKDEVTMLQAEEDAEHQYVELLLGLDSKNKTNSTKLKAQDVSENLLGEDSN